MRKLRNFELNRLDIEGFEKTHKIPVTVVLDQVRSLYNVGSIFRTADAFLIKELILVGITAVPPNKEIDKTALGATETVQWKHYKETAAAIDYIKSTGSKIIVVEQTDQSIDLKDFEFRNEISIVFGHEVKGVDNKWLEASEAAIEIPMAGTKHSFNVGVAAGIVLWELFKKIK
jgi:23S rRNA (guanosine2251-2'-O)-methyltransferase